MSHYWDKIKILTFFMDMAPSWNLKIVFKTSKKVKLILYKQIKHNWFK